MRLQHLLSAITLTVVVSCASFVKAQGFAPFRLGGDTPVNQLRSGERSRQPLSEPTERITLTPQKLRFSTPPRELPKLATPPREIPKQTEPAIPVVDVQQVVAEEVKRAVAAEVQRASFDSPVMQTSYDDQSVLESAPDPVVTPYDSGADNANDAPVLESTPERSTDSAQPKLLYEMEDVDDHAYHVGASGLSSCDSCGSCGSCGSCRCGEPHCFWVRAEYLMWWTKGMDLPPLVTTSPVGTPTDEQGVLGFPNTTILYGNDRIFEDLRKGGRIRMGFWYDPCQRCGIEGEFLGLHDEEEHFEANCFDYPILDRPFIRVDGAPLQTAEIVCGPNLAGQVEVDASTRLYSGAIRFVSNRCCNSFGCGPCCGSVRRDFLFGYRFMSLDEALSIREQLNTLGDNDLDGTVTDPVQNIDLMDRFDTDVRFHGVDFGWRWEYVRSRWSFDLLTKIAMGWNRQVVNINGRTFNSLNGNVVTRNGGLLAQPSNIGRHARNQFSVMPELGVTAGYALRPGVRLTAGYSFLYWTNVVRPGNHIDLNVNPLFLQGATTAVPSRPSFTYNETDYWAQGLNFGVDIRF